ncbi:MAG: hypothetical protein JSR59_10215 [Proteobacteria bacterium]|nr:hypothetical protein [Pseudomonadota bacterium]
MASIHHPAAGYRACAKTLAVLAAAAAAGLICQQAFAQATAHRHIVPSSGGVTSANAAPQDVLPAPRLIPLQAVMSQAYPTIGGNADGSDVWPCYGRSTPNADCPTIGNPVLPLPHGTLVNGLPAYSWALKNDDIFGYGGMGNGIGCDAYINGTTGLPYSQYKPCGQITTFFEDDTNDPDDDLLQRVLVTQGSNVIYDSGVVDFGPAGPITYPVNVELYYDANFGYWPGADNGPNNGNCVPDIGYPLPAPAFPGYIYQIATGSTCHRPIPGKAHIHTETTLGTPSYHQVSGQRCTARNVPSPCYVVSWTQKHQMVQDWDVFMR